jgi:hypothetical protein
MHSAKQTFLWPDFAERVCRELVYGKTLVVHFCVFAMGLLSAAN